MQKNVSIYEKRIFEKRALRDGLKSMMNTFDSNDDNNDTQEKTP